MVKLNWSVIVTSLAAIVPLKFCWLKNNSIVLSSALLQKRCECVCWESDVNVIILALELCPSNHHHPATCDIDIVFAKLTDAEAEWLLPNH